MEEHQMRQECEQRITKLEETAKQFKSHDEQSVTVRDTVITHTEMLKNLCSIKAWFMASAITIVAALVSFAVAWGMVINRVSNLENYTKFIMEHSYGVQEYINK